jgi:hypothetical protein
VLATKRNHGQPISETINAATEMKLARHFCFG